MSVCPHYILKLLISQEPFPFRSQSISYACWVPVAVVDGLDPQIHFNKGLVPVKFIFQM